MNTRLVLSPRCWKASFVLSSGIFMSSCRPDGSTAPASSGVVISRYLAQSAAPAARTLPEITYDTPELSIRDTSVAILDERLEASQGRAFISVKDSAQASPTLNSVMRQDPLGRGRMVRRSVRRALSAKAVDQALASLENAGLEIVSYYENLGIAWVVVPEGGAKAVLGNPWVDLFSPDDIKATATFVRAPRRTGSLNSLMSQAVPWGIAALNAAEAWNYSRGENARLLMIDYGHYQGHEDLASVPTANCMGSYGGGCLDIEESHGTHVLGIMSARDNAIGVVGVAPGLAGSDTYIWRACNKYWDATQQQYVFACYENEIVAALNWAAANLGPRGVVNMSNGQPLPGVLGPAVATAWNGGAGLFLVASTGFGNGATWYPAAFSEVVAAAGIHQDLTFASDHGPCNASLPGSNWGKVDFVAAYDAYSTVVNNQYAGPLPTYCGTSASAPHIAGAALLVRSYFLNYNAWDVLVRLRTTAQSLGDAAHYGFGIPRPHLAMKFMGPFNVTATIVNGKPKLTWESVPYATEYRIYRRVTWDLAPQWSLWATRTTTSYTDNLTPVSSFYGYGTQLAPPGTSVSYYVVAYTPSIESSWYATYATYIPNGTPPY